MSNQDLDTEIQLSHNLKDQIMEKVQTETEVGFTSTPYSAEEVAPLQKSIEQLTKGEVIDTAMDEDDNIHPLMNSILPVPYNLVAETKEGQRLYNTETKELLSVEDTAEVFEDFELGRIVDLREGQKRVRVNLDEESGLIHAEGSENDYTFDSHLVVPAAIIDFDQDKIAVDLQAPETPIHYSDNTVTVADILNSTSETGSKDVEQLNETVAATHHQTGEPCFVGSENYPDYPETEAAGDESFALSAEGSFEAKVEIPGVEEAAQSGEKRIALIGGAATPSLAALTATNQFFGQKQAEEAKAEDVPTPLVGNELSSAEKKRRAAEQHNQEMRSKGKLCVVKFRTSGLTMRYEILTMSNRAINVQKDRGIFAIYTLNSAVAAPRLNILPYAQTHNQSMINQVTLDWLIDQLGETVAFELRSGRILDTTPRKFEVTLSEAEWVAKGFYVNNGNVNFFE